MNKVLLIGINTYPAVPLNGCVNDISMMADFLVENKIFKEKEIRLLADSRATTHAIKDRLEWFVKNVKKGDKLLFYYSGHGAQMPTRDPKGEVDGLDEVICPVDFDWTEDKVIRDKDFDKYFGKIPKGANFIWISDSCHSGDLTSASTHYFYNHEKTGKTKTESELIDIPGQIAKFIPQPIDIHWRTKTAKEENIITRKKNTFNLALISGCRPEQISRDAKFGDTYHGALTYCLLEVLKNGGLNKPLDTLVEETRKLLKKKNFKQIPQLEGIKTIIEKPFFVPTPNK